MATWQARHGLSAAKFQSTFDALRADDYRLIDVCGYTDGSAVRYAGIWVQSGGPAWEARHGMSPTAYQSIFDSLRQAGFRLRRVSAFGTSAGPRFVAIWEKTSSPVWEARHGLTAAQFQAEFARLDRLGFRLVDVCGYNDGGSRYAAIWEKASGADWQARHGLTRAQYQAAFTQLANQGYVLTRVSGHRAGNAVHYAGIWVKRASIGWEGRHDLDAAAYQRAFDELRYQGYQQLQVCAYATPNGPRFAGIWESQHYGHQVLAAAETLATTFMTRFNVPGLSVAITSRGRLVYARAFGLARRSPKVPLTVHHRMRIASVSKPITAAAIMLLVQQGKLRLSRRVFGRGAALGTIYGSVAYSAAERAITVEQLLNHTSGFENTPNDPMFQQLSRNHASLIGWVLDNRNPATTPGTNYHYLNFGYCLLGRIIERITRRSYERYVTSALLAPAGVTSMQLAGDRLSQRAVDEVVYYGQSSESPYSMRIRRMDAHGGWIATPMDLLRFLGVVDGFRPPADRLTAASITRMTTGSSARPTYALGWAVDGAGTWDHNGALPGTLSMLCRRPDRVSQAALLNTRQPNTSTSTAQDVMLQALYQLVDNITAQLGSLPSFDLYQS